MKRLLSTVVTTALVAGVALFGAAATAVAAQDPPAGCVGGVLSNPSVDQTTTGSEGGAPTGYTFVPAANVPSGTPNSKKPRLYTDDTYTQDGSFYALIATPDNQVSMAYEEAPAIPGGVYDLSVWTGTHDTGQDNITGIKFYDANGVQVGQTYSQQVTHDVDDDRKLGRQNLYGMVAPANAAKVRFYAQTNFNWIKWDCVYLRVSAYTILKEVQDPATGNWLDADAVAGSPGSNNPAPAAIPAGGTANYRITVKNVGTEQLTGITVNDPWCTAGLDTAAFSLNGGASKVLTCSHAGVQVADSGHINTATASNVKYWNGNLPNKSETAAITVTPPPANNKVGDYVWVDTNNNGLQDDGEPGVPNVTVKLSDGKTTTTDANGKYLFDQLPDGKYSVCFDLGTLSGQYAGYVPTKPDAGDDAKDSDADAKGCTPETTLGPDKREDLTLDLGIVPPVNNKVGDYVWVDNNRNGLQDADEPGVDGVPVKLSTGATTTTAQGGKYLFDKLPDGKYSVCFDLKNLPAQYAGYLATKPDAGDDTKDSDANADGCTPETTLGPDKREDMTLDAGIRPPNRLGDFVWVDNNRNGLQDADEPGVPDVTVKLNTGATTKTDANGKYIFEKLPDATYTVCFDLANLPAQYAGYLATKPDAGSDDAKDSDAGADGCAPATSLGPEKPEDLTLDAGIRPPNKLGDYVWIDTNKNGLQDDGEPPVPGVTVKLGDKTTTTDAQGKYVFDKLPDGDYTVCFDLKALPQQYADYVATKTNAGDDAKDSDADPATGCAPKTTLGIDNPEDLTIDLGLVPPVNRLGDYVWVDVNKDGLQDASDIPVEGVTVKLNTGATTTTDAQGKYLFDNLPDGSYSVCFDIKNLPAKYADYVVTKQNAGDDAKDSDADPATGCTATTTLGVGKREDLTLDLGLVAPPNKLGDYVWVDLNKNGVQDNGEPGVPNVPVKLSDGKTTTTDANGKYVFDNLPDGKYSVCFGPMPAQYADFQFTKPNAGDDGVDSDADPATGCTPEVELGVGKRENLTLDAGISAPVNRLGDYVWVDSNKNGLQDAGEKPVPGMPVKLNTGQSTTTDAGGKYLFEDLPDGTYTVCFGPMPKDYADYAFTKPNAGDDTKDSDADDKGCAEPVTLGVGKRENLTVDAGIVAPPNRIGDLVWFDKNRNGLQDDGEPGVPGVTVKLSDGTTTKTDADGRYLFPDIPDGTYKVCFDMNALPGEYAGYLATKPNAGDDARDSDVDGATGCTPPVTVGVGKRENLTLDLGIVPPTNRLGDFVWYDDNSNGIQDPKEPGVPNLPVYLQDGNGKPVASTKTDSDGKYLFTDLPDGEYKVCFNADPRSGLVAGRKLTKANVGEDGRDSDADPATGCTPVVKLGKDKRVDLTLDAGLLPKPLAATGASVWGLLAAGLALLLGGAALVLTGRRRRES
ncbi:hypothetical protein Lesp02_75500 [Lentzea sp. NBRC 105346]|uniref:SdrD B-like domain-containing protein n=1 Tax=Lentzea sp. NBRC 105346 TaxID=3032205 RepID=UPI0024A1FEE0|nr:SdrD B-like domain-containing protein [Lentzea sp. NBRC 105346]GLZ35363.1 hypothetical protein Lesp02_75500 [Lentzea sp. NBRC 105346]